MKKVLGRHKAGMATGLSSGDARFMTGYFFLFSIYGITTPFLQVLIKGLGYDSAQIGFYLGLFEAAGIGGQLLLARVADRSGAYRPWLLLTAALTILSAFPLALFPSPLITAMAVVAMAFGVRGMVPVMDASVVAHTQGNEERGDRVEGERPGETRAKRGNYGLIRSVGSIGYICMLLVTQTANLQHGKPLAIASWEAGAAVIFMLILVIVPESGRLARKEPTEQRKSRGRLDLRLFLGLVIIGLGRLAMAPVNSFFTLYVTDVVKGDMAGIYWALSAAAEVPALIVAKRFIDRFGPMRVLAVSTAAIAVRLSLYIVAPNVAGVIAAQLLHFFCYGLFLPSAIAFVSSLVPPERRVWGMSLLTGVAVGFPSFLGSSLGGMILERGGYDALFGWAIVPAILGLAIWFATRKTLDVREGSVRTEAAR
ncbi:MAG TPA: MFS transporter [Rectinemataceae bacterium]|nr:MFS transporter [Rectinemataceae bacterium]